MASVLLPVLSFLKEPRPAQPPATSAWDWILAGLLAAIALAEGTLRDSLVWRPAALVMGIGLVLFIPWRRAQPLATSMAVFLPLHVVQFVAIVNGVGWSGLNTHVYALLFPYALFRWGSGREAALGLAAILIPYAINASLDFKGYGDAIGGGVICMLPALLGATFRFRSQAWDRDMERVKSREREQLAREVHDTVAHHVSAMIIQAQAGCALGELREIVQALRGAEDAVLTPQRGLADIARLAATESALRVEVGLPTGLESLTPHLESALFRIAQESITNAVRHARNASCIHVVVTKGPESIRLTVQDDGESVPVRPMASAGFGLAGMKERAALLGGTLRAGPEGIQGCKVEAAFPLGGIRK